MITKSFSIFYRNPGHWDITISSGRAFRIRGEPGKCLVFDERPPAIRKQTMEFKTVGLCMSYICEELMYEDIEYELPDAPPLPIKPQCQYQESPGLIGSLFDPAYGQRPADGE